jgi:hypothetical protein
VKRNDHVLIIVSCRHVSNVAEEYHEKPQDSWCSGQNSIGTFHEYKAKAPLLRQRALQVGRATNEM